MEEVYCIDEESGTYYKIKSFNKYTKAVQVVFDLREESNSAPVGHKNITCHMILDVNMVFTRKA